MGRLCPEVMFNESFFLIAQRVIEKVFIRAIAGVSPLLTPRHEILVINADDTFKC